MDPETITAYCDACGGETLHEVMRVVSGGKRGMHVTARCSECGLVHQVEMSFERVKEIPIVVSWMGTSENDRMVAPLGERLRVGDEIYLDDDRLLITGIEADDGRMVKEAEVERIKTLFTKRYDRVRVKVSINRGSRTTSRNIFVAPEEEFEVGEVLEVDGIKAVIHRMKLEEHFITRGAAPARKIVRIYAKEVREKWRR
jgi:uncharacterized Zn finger protein